MSTPTAWAVVLIVLILAALVAYIAWLGQRGNGRNCQPYVGGYMLCLCLHCPEHAAQRHSGVHPPTPIDDVHKDCADQNDHPEYVTREELESWRAQYVRRDELNRLIDEQVNLRMNEQLKVSRSSSIDSLKWILYAILIGGVGGGILGWVVSLMLPRSVFEQHANTTFVIGDQQIDQILTTFSSWPMYGIVLGGAFVGVLVGIATLLIVNTVRKNRQTIEGTQ